MRFWLSCWYWEYPTLFGLENQELQGIIEQWPNMIARNEKNVALAISAEGCCERE
jgi:hypothetical protein